MLQTADGLPLLDVLNMIGPESAGVLLTDVFSLAFKKLILFSDPTSIFTEGGSLARVSVMAGEPIPLE